MDPNNANGNEALTAQSDGPETLAQPSTTRQLIEVPQDNHTDATTLTTAAGVPVPPTHPLDFLIYTEEDFDDVVTTWGRYNTEKLVKSSRFYTKTEIATDWVAGKQIPEKKDIMTRVVHAVHPIPRDTLQWMGPRCVRDLGVKLEEERWDIDRNPAFDARVQETLARIDDALEFIFRVQMPGARVYSGRQPTEL